MGKKKLTLEVIKEKLSIINPKVEILSDKYTNANSKLKCRCKLDGYEWKTTWGSLSTGKGCNKCAGRPRLTLKQAERIFEDKGYLLSLTKYSNSTEKLTAQTKEGYSIYASISDLTRGHIPYIFGKNNPYTIDNIKLWLKINNSPYKLISTKYKSAKDKLTLLCPIHGEIQIIWDNLRTGGGCSICGGTARLTLDEIKTRLKIINPNIEILSKKYTNSKTKLKCKCNICDNIWCVTSDNLLHNKNGCPICGINKMSGSTHPNWNPNKSQEERDIERNYVEYYQFVKNTMKRDNYTCQITKKRGCSLVVHHLNGYHWFIEGRTDINNAITISEEEHKLFHRIYGRNNNTKEQYEEFKKMRLEQLHMTEFKKAI